MLPYEIFFFGVIFFLGGVLAASAGIPPFFVTTFGMIVSILCVVLRIRTKNTRISWYAGLILFLVVGSLYYRIDNTRFFASPVVFETSITFSGVVEEDPVIKESGQEIVVGITVPYHARILVRLPAYPRFAYGDVIHGKGKIQKPSTSSYAHYLEKERIRGTMSFASVKKVGQGGGFSFRTALFAIKHRIMNAFVSVLPPEEATFLSGLTIGARGSFSKELKDNMQKSGTTHLVALSGYNITILVSVAMSFLLFLFSRRTAFIFTILLIVAFVVMTGAEASVVRAAIVGFLALLASEIGRVYDIRNAVLCAALVMVLINPKVLAFDIGFQLSFLALLGIVYLHPALQRFLSIAESTTIFSWRENILTTLAAQLAVTPILIANFGFVSLISLFANVAILEFIPITMGLGFLIAGVSFLSHTIAQGLGFFVSLFLKIELFLISFFAHIPIPVSFKAGVVFTIVWYVGLGVLVWRYTIQDAGRNIQLAQNQ
ncbi:MAG: ComEC/Rec2 family competence protein [Candidatus Paceibacterota bacterium]|jgi:competence protein ComEC